MLQNPSKYHPHPLSHFLALHNSQAAHNARNNGNNNNNVNNNHNHTNNTSNILTNVSAFGLCGSQFQIHQHQPQQQQPQQQHQQQQQQQTLQEEQLNAQNFRTHNLGTTATTTTTTTHAHQHAQFLDATGTTIDVGKSFTIAAILGLQNRNSVGIGGHNNTMNNMNAMSNDGNQCNKDFNSVINLSLNGNNSGSIVGLANQHHAKQQAVALTTTSMNKDCGSNNRDSTSSSSSNTNNNNNSSNINNNNHKFELTMSTSNKFNCDNNVGIGNPFLVNPNAAVAHQNHSHTQQQSQQHHHQHHHHSHPLMASHVRAIAAVAANVVNGGPTALQSLQQLHQHHAQQTSMTFARDKLKSDNHAKKASLKNKRVRTIFTPEQLERLEAEFERQQYMVGPERLYLAHTLQLTEAQVKVWFQNRRIKWRKHHLELTQQRLALLRQNQLPTGNITTNMPALPSPDGLATAASNSSFDDNDEPNTKSEEIQQSNSQRSHSETESELSVCNDSMDVDSINDGGGDT